MRIHSRNLKSAISACIVTSGICRWKLVVSVKSEPQIKFHEYSHPLLKRIMSTVYCINIDNYYIGKVKSQMIPFSQWIHQQVIVILEIGRQSNNYTKVTKMLMFEHLIGRKHKIGDDVRNGKQITSWATYFDPCGWDKEGRLWTSEQRFSQSQYSYHNYGNFRQILRQAACVIPSQVGVNIPLKQK